MRKKQRLNSDRGKVTRIEKKEEVKRSNSNVRPEMLICEEGLSPKIRITKQKERENSGSDSN
jgi:hypothetical protein